MTEDTFPYKRYSMPDTPADYFRRAQEYRPFVDTRVLRNTGDEGRLLRADQVLSRTSRQAFLKHFPLYYLKPELSHRFPRAVVIRTPAGAYNDINIFPDYYTEDARVRDRGVDEKISPYQYWQQNSGRFDSGDVHENRETLWREGPKEARQGKITNYLTLFSLLKSRVVLDPSAAWGDRLIAALASPTVEVYTGVDPHSRLPRGWQEILDELGPLSGKKNYKQNFVMINEPFEPTTGTPLPEMGNYDTCLISPPPLFGDQYDAGNPNQAVARHGASMKDYVRGFLIPYMTRAISALKVGGYLCITELDRPRDSYYITEPHLLLTELLVGSAMHYRGVIWWEGDRGGLVPWWIFVKSDKAISQERLKETEQMYSKYSDL